MRKVPNTSKVLEVARPADLQPLRAAATCEFERLFYEHDGRLIHKWHHYLAVYDRYFSPIRSRHSHGSPPRPVRFLEIGVSRGGSLQLWRRFFGKGAVIYGIDVDEACRERASEGCEVRIGHQADGGFLRSVVEEMGGLDIVLDDGSHKVEDQIASFRMLYPLLALEGLYACEDIFTSYHPPYGGGFRKPGTFIEFAKALIDDMHAWSHDEIVEVSSSPEIASTIAGIHMHEGMVLIEKQEQPERFKVKVGAY